jgi:hypothetical protein
VTWIFVYTVVTLLGLLLGVASGPLRRLPLAIDVHRLVLPRADSHRGVLPRLVRSAGVGIAVFGLIGVVLSSASQASPTTVATIATAPALAAALLFAAAGRKPRLQAVGSRQALVVRAMAPGAYGQVKLEGAGRQVVMAARNVGDSTLPTGSIVEVVSDERSVLTVRRADDRA